MIVACVLKTGGCYTPEYVMKLQNGVSRFLKRRYDFVCLTDHPHPSVNSIPLKHDWKGWWSKIELFRPDIFPKGERVLYFDLDTVLVGNCTSIASIPMPSMLNGFKNRFASGILCFEAGKHDNVYLKFKDGMRRFDTPKMLAPDDQKWIAKCLTPDVIHLIKNKEHGIVSYKHHILRKERLKPPKHAKIVCFHGKPRPHRVSDLPWMLEYWR